MRVRLLGHYIHLPLLGLLAAEMVAFALSLHLGVNLRLDFDARAVESQIGALWPQSLLFSLIVTLSMLSLGMYATRQRARFLGLALRVVIAMMAAFGVIAVVFYLFPGIEIGRGALLISLLLATAASIGLRLLFFRLAGTHALKKRVLVYGQTSQMAAFRRLRRRSDRVGYWLVGLVHHPGDPVDPLGEPVYEAPGGLAELCVDLDIDELVVALQDRRQRLPSTDLLRCRLAGVTVTEFITFLERETGRVPLDLLKPSWIIFGSGYRRGGFDHYASRGVDFLASAILLVIASPIMLLTVLAIWLEDGRKGAPFLYRQERVGYEGRLFNLVKFRSMRTDAEAGGAPQWASKNDPRVTRVGSFIRKTRIDELPQLVNVLKGQMSFVGPRPERPEFVRQLEKEIPYYIYRHSVKPGITGWAQLCYPYGSSVEDAAQKLQYDLYYVKNHNLLFDLGILLQTVEVVIMGKGAR